MAKGLNPFGASVSMLRSAKTAITALEWLCQDNGSFLRDLVIPENLNTIQVCQVTVITNTYGRKNRVPSR